MTFYVGRTQVGVRLATVLFLAFCIVAGEGERLAAAILSLAVHEAAHIVAAKNLGRQIDQFTVYPFGAVMILDGWNDVKSEAITATAGPVGSLAFAGMLRLFKEVLPLGTSFDALIQTNLLLAMINMLPAFPLDGGRTFRALLYRAVRERTANRLLFTFTVLIAISAEGMGAWMLVRGYPAWTFLAIPPFLVISALSEMKRPENTVSHILNRKSVLKSGMPQKAQTVVVSETATVGDAIASLSNRRYTVLHVLGNSESKDIDESLLLDAAAKFGCETTLKTVISRLTSQNDVV